MGWGMQGREKIAAAAAIALLFGYAAVLSTLWRLHGEHIWQEDCDIDFGLFYTKDALLMENRLLPTDEYRGPLYPMLLASLHRRGWDIIAAGRRITIASSLLVLTLVFLICRSMTGQDHWALATMFLCACFPPFLKYSLLLGGDMLFAALVICSVYLLVTAERGFRIFISGIFMGASLLARWNAIALALISVFLLLIFRAWRDAWRPNARRSFLFIAGVLLGCSYVCALNLARGRGLFENSNFRYVGYAFYGADLGLEYHRYFNDPPFKTVGDILRFRGVTFFLARWLLYSFHYLYRYLTELMLPVSIFAVISILGLGSKKFGQFLIPAFVLCSIVPHSLCPYGSRYVLPLFPLGLCAAAWAALRIHDWWKNHRAARLCLLIAYAVALFRYAGASHAEVDSLFAPDKSLGHFIPDPVFLSPGTGSAIPEGYEVLYNFNAYEIRKGWTHNDLINLVTADDEKLRISCRPDDPTAVSPKLRLPLQGDISFMIRMRALPKDKPSWRDRLRERLGFREGLKMQVFWTTDRRKHFHESRSAIFYILPGDEPGTHLVRLLPRKPLGKPLPRDQGSFITRIRFDPGDSRREYEIHGAGLLRRKVISDCNAAMHKL